LITLRDYLPVPGTVVLDTYNFGGNVSVLRIFQEEISSYAGVSSKPISSRSQKLLCGAKNEFHAQNGRGILLEFRFPSDPSTRHKRKSENARRTSDDNRSSLFLSRHTNALSTSEGLTTFGGECVSKYL